MRTISCGRFLAWSLGLPAATLIITSAVMSIPADTCGIDLHAGSESFERHCRACHFAKAGFPAHVGPNLHDIGKTAGTRRPNQSAAGYILESILDPPAFISPDGRPGMQPDVAKELDPEEIRNIVGFLASRGATADYEEISRLDIPDRRSERLDPVVIRRQEMETAVAVLKKKGSCLNCHDLYAAPECQVVAPALFAAGLNDPIVIRRSIVDPHHDIKPQYKSAQVVLTDGQVATGRIVSRTRRSLVLQTLDEHQQIAIREIPLADIEMQGDDPQIIETNTSLMPTGFDKLLSDEEIESVIKLIQQLN